MTYIHDRDNVTTGCYEHISDGGGSDWGCNYHYDLDGALIHLACIAGTEVCAFWDVDSEWFYEIDEEERDVVTDPGWDAVVETIKNELGFPTEKEVEKARKSVLALLSKLEPK